MKTVKLAKSIRFPGGPLLKQGKTLEVDDAVFDEYFSRGVFVVEVPVEPDVSNPVSEPPAGDEPVGVEDEVERPAKSAPATDWRDYAEALGMDTKGLSKAEIIAATA